MVDTIISQVKKRKKIGSQRCKKKEALGKQLSEIIWREKLISICAAKVDQE